MSTELFEAKNLADEIHQMAGVPGPKNQDIYNMTLEHITHLVTEMDKRGITMGEQRTRMGRKKDELISALIDLRQRGVLFGESEEPRKVKPIRKFKADQIKKVSRQ